MKNNIIKVTGNNRKAVLAFLDKHMLPSHRPSNVSGLLVSKENCYIELKNNYFTTHLEYNGPTMTLKEVRKIYEPKQTENEKRLQGRASMYKLKYEKLKEVNDELEKELDINETNITSLLSQNADFNHENMLLRINYKILNNENNFLKKECKKLSESNSFKGNKISELILTNKLTAENGRTIFNMYNNHKEIANKSKSELDTHLQLNSELRVTNTRLTDELIELEGKYNAKSFELDQSEQTNQSLIKEKYRYIAMIALLTITVITLCVIN